jgi:hypothetical protein
MGNKGVCSRCELCPLDGRAQNTKRRADFIVRRRKCGLCGRLVRTVELVVPDRVDPRAVVGELARRGTSELEVHQMEPGPRGHFDEVTDGKG